MLKKLIGKNQTDYELAASYLMNSADIDLFARLVEQDAFLFDFVKQNVAKRIIDATNEANWKSVFSFMKFYSPYYEDAIILPIVEHADDDITDRMLDLLINGTNAEKTYCAKFFSYIQDPLATDWLIKFSFDEDDFLATNCAKTLSLMKETSSYDIALQKLSSADDFEKFKAVKFLVNYGDKTILNSLVDVMNSSALSENIAAEIPYLCDLSDIFDFDFDSGLLTLNNIINGLGEIIPIVSVFDYGLFDIFNFLLNRLNDSRVAVVLLNACDKFDTLTENDEYLFDEDKNTKNEIFDIKNLLSSLDKNLLLKLSDKELNDCSKFVFTALEYTKNILLVRDLLKSDNQTIILKTAEILKKFDKFDETAKTVALLKITDENIRDIIRAL